MSRPGGDEFVLFLYDYESEEALQKTIETLTDIQDHSFVQLKENREVPLRFSFGYCLTKEETDYQMLFKEADRKMYENKLERKKDKTM